MKNAVTFLLLLSVLIPVRAQMGESPVSWKQEVKTLGAGEYELILQASIEEGWHVYSQHTAEGGSLPTEFTFVDAGTAYELDGPTEESETVTEYNDVFEVEETFFKDRAEFHQRIHLLDTNLRQVQLELFYQVCKEVCIPEERTFYFSLDGSKVTVAGQEVDSRSQVLGESLKLDIRNKDLLNEGNTGGAQSGSGLWMLFGLGFLGGLIALLTPCVFPMIPLTVSFFTKHSQSRSGGIRAALLYGFFIMLIYFLLSLPFHLFDTVDSQILNTIATNVWLNIFFFVVFVFFAFSFFGFYELTLPNSWANRMDRASSRAGGVVGIFFMALTLAIVSFSCTGPILGGLLGSTTLAVGDVATNLSAGMLGFGLALGLPFALFALFPAWLNSLPRSGGWMNTVKGVLGFLELGLALKFLSNADLVGHWGLLKREIFLGAWALLALLMTGYLFGLFRIYRKEARQKISGGRLVAGMVSALFTLYLGLGLFHVIPLKMLSGFPPPDFYSVVQQESDCPLGIDCFKDFEAGIAHARAVDKPVLLDFTGWACVNCRKMEENVWSEPDIYPMLKEDVVLISLYIDDRKSLPEEEQFTFRFDTGRLKNIETIGQKWGTFQTVNFGAASQPYYVMLTPDLELLNPAIQNTDSEHYREWLRSGLRKFRKLSMAGTTR